MPYLKNAAFSLSEVLVALFLGSLLTSLALHQFFSVKKQFQYLSHTLHCNLNESLIVDLLRDTVFHAGFTPYGSIEQLQPLHTEDTRRITAIEPLSSPLHGFIARRMGSSYVPLIRIHTNTIAVPEFLHIQQNQPLIVCNWCCYQLLTVKNIHRKNDVLYIDLQQPLHDAFQVNSFVGRWIEERYELKQNPQKETSGLYYYQHHHNELLVDKWTSFSIRKSTSQKMGISILLKDKQQKEVFILSEAPNV